MNDDLISRQAAIDILKEPEQLFEGSTDFPGKVYSLFDIGRNAQLIVDRMRIETVPAIEPERQNGEWRITLDNDEKMYECSVCKCRMMKEPYDFAVGLRGYNHCPYCGAKMKGVKNDV